MLKPRQIWGGLGNQMFQHAYIYSQMKDGLIPDIYLQDEKYFKKYSEDIKAIYGYGINHDERISLHVRRGDYINNPFYEDLSKTDYYERAIEQFPGARFLVFCADRQAGSNDLEDQEWCKQKFQGNRFDFFVGVDEVEDMNAMASCKGHIMANSSFSWWAAYLGGGKTVCPKQWFSDGIPRVGLLDEWIKL